jgi:hypothetical protein
VGVTVRRLPRAWRGHALYALRVVCNYALPP